jgi:hypothetical protein
MVKDVNMDLSTKKGTISYQVAEYLDEYDRLNGLKMKKDFVLNVMFTYSIVGPNTARDTLDSYRKIVSRFKTEIKLDEYLFRVLEGGRHYNPGRFKKNNKYFEEKWSYL